MCDYSLHAVKTRPAKVQDKLVTTQFPNTMTRGFTATEDPNVAVCLLPGTELAFEREAEWFVKPHSIFRWRNEIRRGERVARFRKINEDKPHVHHDALEFPNGNIVLLSDLREGQTATVLQLPAERSTNKQETASSTNHTVPSEVQSPHRNSPPIAAFNTSPSRV